MLSATLRSTTQKPPDGSHHTGKYITQIIIILTRGVKCCPPSAEARLWVRPPDVCRVGNMERKTYMATKSSGQLINHSTAERLRGERRRREEERIQEMELQREEEEGRWRMAEIEGG